MLTPAQTAEVSRIVAFVRAAYAAGEFRAYPAQAGFFFPAGTWNPPIPAAWEFHPMDYAYEWINWDIVSDVPENELDSAIRSQLFDIFTPAL